MNCCVEHRGGVGYEKNTGDGAGILTGLPHAMLQDIAQQVFDQALPEPGGYGVGVFFCPPTLLSVRIASRSSPKKSQLPAKC